MKIYNEQKTQILDNPDLKKGWLREDKIIIKTIPATEEVQEQGHYETIREYENGGKDVEWVVDVEGIPAKPEAYEYEDIYVYIPYTEEEFKQNKLRELTIWFDKDYPKYEQMLIRRKTLGIEDTIVDEFRNKTYHNIIELYTEAEVVAGEIRRLREN